MVAALGCARDVGAPARPSGLTSEQLPAGQWMAGVHKKNIDRCTRIRSDYFRTLRGGEVEKKIVHAIPHLGTLGPCDSLQSVVAKEIQDRSLEEPMRNGQSPQQSTSRSPIHFSLLAALPCLRKRHDLNIHPPPRCSFAGIPIIIVMLLKIVGTLFQTPEALLLRFRTISPILYGKSKRMYYNTKKCSSDCAPPRA